MRGEHVACGLAFGEAIRHGRLCIDDQPVAVLHQQMPQRGESRFAVVRFAIQPRIGIRRRRVRLVLARLFTEVAPVAVGVAILPLKRRAVAGESSLRPSLCAVQHAGNFNHMALDPVDDQIGKIGDYQFACLRDAPSAGAQRKLSQ